VKLYSKETGRLLANKLRGSNFIHRHHVRIAGDVKVGNLLIIGGNLTVDGDLQAAKIYCFGSLTDLAPVFRTP
jgi:hypothetical protein